MFNDSVYNLLKKSDVDSLKIVEVITDNQTAIDTNQGRYSNHIDMIDNLERSMYRNEDAYMDRKDDNVHIMMSSEGATIDFPNSRRISEEQVHALLHFMVEVSRYNRQVPNRKKIPISIIDYDKTGEIYDIQELKQDTKKEWVRHYRKARELDKEIIIGKKHSNGLFGKIFK